MPEVTSDRRISPANLGSIGVSIVNLKSLAIAAVAVSTLTNQAQARDAIQIAGSSTVFSFAAVVAEQFHNSHPQFPASIVASGGTTGGLTLFCQGIGDHTIDIVNASRLIRPAEIQACHERGVTDIIEVRIGYDGIVFASHTSGPDFSLTPRSLWLAIAARVPVNNQLVPNPNTNWRQISPSLPNQEIQLFIPGENHGTREVFEERVLDAGCEAVPEIQALSTANDVRTHACRAVRRDSRVVDITGDYTETLARIQSSPHAVGVFG
jgi:phosphate transport system substrate-binding protein